MGGEDFRFDYAFGYHDAIRGINDLGSSHRFNFTLCFGKNFSTIEEMKKRMLARYYRRGMECLRMKEYARAVLIFNRILIIDPTSREALKGMKEASKRLNSLQIK